MCIFNVHYVIAIMAIVLKKKKLFFETKTTLMRLESSLFSPKYTTSKSKKSKTSNKIHTYTKIFRTTTSISITIKTVSSKT